ncbi:MAG: thioredoxin-dependent peroxiredoxin [Pseudonocardiales bacterium]|nr:thioredoxin-dependent peroxiredoxin [Pseudonocardiales bacterium]
MGIWAVVREPESGHRSARTAKSATPGDAFSVVVTVADMRAGEEVPDFELPDQDGTPRRLSTLLEDGPIVLFFYPAAMTAGCTKEACHFRDLGAEFAAAGVQRVGISRDAIEKQKQFSDKHSFDYPLLSDVDGTVATIFGVQRGGVLGKLGAAVKRWTFAIGTDRRVVAVIHSELNMDLHADQALQAFGR